VSEALERAEETAFRTMAQSAGLSVLEVAGATCIAHPAAANVTLLNRVVALGLGGPVGDAELDEIDAFFRSHATRYAVPLAPFAPRELEARLLERGFTVGYPWMRFERDVVAPPSAPTQLRIVEVDGGGDFATVVNEVFGLPPQAARVFDDLPRLERWHCFVAYDGDTPAATGALCVHDDVGWLGCAGTVPAQRGKGAQSALLATRVTRAAELGLRALTTETGERSPDRPASSYRNILRAGFTEAYLRPNLLSPEP